MLSGVRLRRGYGEDGEGLGWAPEPRNQPFGGKRAHQRPPGRWLNRCGMPGGCPLTPKSAIESHLGFAESFRVHEPISTSQFAAVAALPPRNNSLRYTMAGGRGRRLPTP